jgi:hypothetical protein
MLKGIPAIDNVYYFFGNIDLYRYISSIRSDMPLIPEIDWDFSV